MTNDKNGGASEGGSDAKQETGEKLVDITDKIRDQVMKDGFPAPGTFPPSGSPRAILEACNITLIAIGALMGELLAAMPGPGEPEGRGGDRKASAPEPDGTGGDMVLVSPSGEVLGVLEPLDTKEPETMQGTAEGTGEDGGGVSPPEAA